MATPPSGCLLGADLVPCVRIRFDFHSDHSDLMNDDQIMIDHDDHSIMC